MKQPIINIEAQHNCPSCSVSWDGGDIYECLRNHEMYKEWTDEQIREAAGHYGWSEDNKKRFSRLIGIEDCSYDGISYWQCPDCKKEWNRFTGQQM